ncbi:hypothetical protein KM043_008240 [Ampulex compressa]|nr:hypothetical protein KM043_008240 [Ampulex compressa]
MFDDAVLLCSCAKQDETNETPRADRALALNPEFCKPRALSPMDIDQTQTACLTDKTDQKDGRLRAKDESRNGEDREVTSRWLRVQIMPAQNSHPGQPFETRFRNVSHFLCVQVGLPRRAYTNDRLSVGSVWPYIRELAIAVRRKTRK